MNLLTPSPQTDGPVQLLRPREAAQRLRVSRATLDRWVRRGLIKRIKLGARISAFRATDIERLCETGFPPQLELREAQA